MFYADISEKVYLKSKLLLSEDKFSLRNNVYTIEKRADVSIDIKNSSGRIVYTVSSGCLDSPINFGNLSTESTLRHLINVTVSIDCIYIVKVNSYCNDITFILSTTKKDEAYYSFDYRNSHSTLLWNNQEIFKSGMHDVIALGADCKSVIAYNTLGRRYFIDESGNTYKENSLYLINSGVVVETKTVLYREGETVCTGALKDDNAMKLLRKLSGEG